VPSASGNASGQSSGSGSKSTSFSSTPRLLSRRNSSKDTYRQSSSIIRKLSGKGKAREIDVPPDDVAGEVDATDV
jgi:hypothetical protein